MQFDPALPINARRDEIRAAIDAHPIVIVCGETGSGKTTQLPKILLERNPRARIGHTQPRRIAARSVAARIAEELGTELGERVGYKVRFHQQVGKSAYLGTHMEYTVATPIGQLFVVERDVSRPIRAGAEVSITLAGHGVALVPS